ncbi:MAG: pirin family protein [Bacteroidota bacterium]
MDNRNSIQIIKSERLNMGGTIVKQPLPHPQLQQASPFLLLHHFGPDKVAPGHDPLGVGPHPHRGFEPVTFLYSGGIEHKDSRGNVGQLTGGDVQWMTAGLGIIHSEMASAKFLAEGGTMEGIQLWVNLRKQDKMTQPDYQDIKSEQIPTAMSEDGAIQVRVVAGTWRELTGPAHTFTPIQAIQLFAQQDGTVDIETPTDHQVIVYVLNGEISLNSGTVVGNESLVRMDQSGERTILQLKEGSRVLYLAGAIIDEPVAQWGPYVMNTQTEIMEAMRDYQMGKMGVYIP